MGYSGLTSQYHNDRPVSPRQRVAVKNPVRTKTPAQSEKILSVAARLFGTHRFHEVRMDDIASAAEVGKGTLYRYFSDKEELYLAILSRAADHFSERMEAVVAGGGSPQARLEALVATIIDEFDAEPHLLELIQRAEVLRPAGQEFPWQHTRELMPKLMRGLFDEAAACGEFRVRDPELTVWMLLGGIRALIRFGPRPEGMARRVVENFLDGAAP